MNDKQLPDDIETPILGMPPLPICQNCDGSGTVVSYVTGELLACWFCKGTGIAPFAVAPGGGGGVGSFYGDYYEVERVSEYSVKLIKAWAEAHIVSLGTKQTLALIELVANALGDSFHAGFENGWEERDQCEVEELDPGEELTDEDVVAIAEGGAA